ncbi:hypothetical protein C1Y40_00979 [Mycobacterium talmoniae]|uniref:RNA 2',3'-cyclic phosphodiesterase n=1 Tax=Mycobacterium talmoniae TaxID=1858794 RepID=A0A2S8BQA4_9MYCO|nr:hypothetical protein C1Y40_00979 [Mycobacterium talmoniae]
MALAVCLLFDRRSERAVRALWDRLEQHGVPSLASHTHRRHVPHLSYAVLRSWDLAAVTAALAALDDGSPVQANFDGVGLFRRGRTWLVAGVSAELMARQQRVVEAVTATGADLHKHYRPGIWLPHCSLAPRARLPSCRWPSPRCSTCCRCRPRWTAPPWSTARPVRSARCRRCRDAYSGGAAATTVAACGSAAALICSNNSV